METGLLIHLLSAAATIGAVVYATRDHGRRLVSLEETKGNHERRISTVEGELKIALPAQQAARAAHV